MLTIANGVKAVPDQTKVVKILTIEDAIAEPIAVKLPVNGVIKSVTAIKNRPPFVISI